MSLRGKKNLRREWHADKSRFLASRSSKMVGVKLEKVNKHNYGN